MVQIASRPFIATLAALGATSAGCDGLLESQTITLEIFAVEVKVTGPAGTDLGGIPVTFSRSDRLTTNAQGRLRVNYQGAVGGKLHIAVQLPERLKPTGPTEYEFVLEHDEEGRPAPVRFYVPVTVAPAGGEPADDGRARYVVVVDSDCPGQEVEVDGESLGRTDEDGYLEKSVLRAPGGRARVVAKPKGDCSKLTCAFDLPEQGAILSAQPGCEDDRVEEAAPEPAEAPRAARLSVDAAAALEEIDAPAAVDAPPPKRRSRPRRGRSGRGRTAVTRAEEPAAESARRRSKPAPTAAKGAAALRADPSFDAPEARRAPKAFEAPVERPPVAVARRQTPAPREPPPRLDADDEVEVEAPPSRPIAKAPAADVVEARSEPEPEPEPKRPADGRRTRVRCNPAGLDLYVDGKLALRNCGRDNTVYISPGVRKLTLSGPECAETRPTFTEVPPRGRVKPIKVLGECRSNCLDRIRDQVASGTELVEGELSCLKRVPVRQADYLEAKLMLAHVYTTQGQSRRAERVLHEALGTRRGQSDPELRVRLAELLGKRRQLRRASREAEAAWRYRMKFRGSRHEREQWILNTLKLRAGFFEQLFYAEEENDYYDKAVATYTDLERTARQSKNNDMVAYARRARSRVEVQRRRLDGE